MQVDFKRLTVVSALGLSQLIAFGTSLYLLTALSGPIGKETGWSLGWVVGGYSVGTMISATVSALAGRYVGAGQGRFVLCISSVLFAFGLTLITCAPNLGVYMLAWVVMGLAMGTGLYDVAFGTAGRLFGSSARAAIIQIALWGGFASTVFWPLSHLIESHWGWRLACLAFASLHLVICLPLYLFVVPKPADAAPVSVRLRPVVKPEGEEWAIYLALGVVVTLEMAIVATIAVHMHAILTGRGLSLAAAVALSATVGPSQVFARLMELTLGRRWPPYVSLVLGVVGMTAGIALIAGFAGLSLPALVLYGAGLGIVSITSGTVPLAVFGSERYPALMGRIRRVGSVIQALAPFAAAALLSRFGTMSLLYALLALSVLCLTTGVFLARRSHLHLTGCDHRKAAGTSM